MAFSSAETFNINTQRSVVHTNVEMFGEWPVLYAPSFVIAREIPYEMTDSPPYHASTPSPDEIARRTELDFYFEFYNRPGLEPYLHERHVYYDEDEYGQNTMRDRTGLGSLVLDWVVATERLHAPAIQAMGMGGVPCARVAFNDGGTWDLGQYELVHEEFANAARRVQDKRTAARGLNR